MAALHSTRRAPARAPDSFGRRLDDSAGVGW